MLKKENTRTSRRGAGMSVTLGGALLGLALLTACQAGQNNHQPETDQQKEAEPVLAANAMSIHPEKIQSSNTCAPGVKNRWVDNEQDYAALFAQLEGAMLSSSAPKPPTVDFNRYGVLMIAMGQQRTGGYGVKLASRPLSINGDVATLHVEWLAPAPGMMVIQMLSNPCLLVKVPRGGFSQIQVVDQHNQVQAQVSLS